MSNEKTRRLWGFLAFLIGGLVASAVVAAPMVYHQFPHPRPGLFWYPVLFVILIVIQSLALAHVSRLSRIANPTERYYVLLTMACLGGALSVPWFATLGPELLGDNGWHGNVFWENLFCALLSLASALWIALAIRLLGRNVSTKRYLGTTITGALLIQGLWLIYYARVGLPAFWIVADAIFNSHKAVYLMFEALVGQLVWPIGILCVAFAAPVPTARNTKGGTAPASAPETTLDSPHASTNP